MNVTNEELYIVASSLIIFYGITYIKWLATFYIVVVFLFVKCYAIEDVSRLAR